jgi:hypothetical protein
VGTLRRDAHLDANPAAPTFEALVFVTTRGEDRATVDAFEQAVAAIPHVRQALRLIGEPDSSTRAPAQTKDGRPYWLIGFPPNFHA